MEFTQKKQIISFLKKHLPKKQPIVVWVSWWPDSMCLISVIQEYFVLQWWEQNLINIAHFNHGQRTQSQKEYVFLKEYFPYNTFYRNTNIPSKWLWETNLREKRHVFFEEVLEDSKSTILFLWHNLTDRIETSLLNMVRGAWVEWIQSIKEKSIKTQYTILRPLLWLDKTTIQKICDQNQISYFIDKTNSQSNNPRNTIRNTILPLLLKVHSGWEKNRLESRRFLYESLPSKRKNTKTHWRDEIPHPLWWKVVWKSIKIKKLSYDQRKILFGDWYYVTKKTLDLLGDFIEKRSGYISIWWWMIFKEGNHIHCFQWIKEFWKQKHTEAQKIKKAGKINFFGKEIVVHSEDIGKTIRFPQPWDTHKWKRLLKVLLNKKIPVFKRNTTPILTDGEKIVAIIS